jgi:hypothetical protein
LNNAKSKGMKTHLIDRDKVALCGRVVQIPMEIDITKVTCLRCKMQIERIGRNKYDYMRKKK